MGGTILIKSLFFIVILSTYSFTAAFCEEVEGERKAAGSKYQFIGMSYNGQQPLCTTWIMRHGFLVTAKHCFTHLGMDEARANSQILPKLNIEFTSKDGKRFILGAKDLTSIKFDKGVNDFAYITYPEELTKTEISIPKLKIFEGSLEAIPNAEVVGFVDNGQKRVVSKGCSITGYTGLMMPTIKNPGYDGPLYDTTCAAWFYLGGGPVLKSNGVNSFIVYGVVTHTFDVKRDGSIDDDKVLADEFGPYASANFSAFLNSESFLEEN